MATRRGADKPERARGGKGGHLDLDAFLALPAEGRAAPLVIAAGEEPFLRDRVLAGLAAALPAAERVEVRFEKRGGPPPARALDELRSASLFAREKLVVVRGAEWLVAESADAIERHARSGARGRVLFLDMEKLDARTRFGKAAPDLGVVVACKRLYADAPPWHRGPQWDTPLARFTVSLARARGKRVGLEDAYYLTQLVGADLTAIDQTLEKLALLVGEREQLAAADIDQVAPRTRRDAAFAVADALLRRDPAAALTRVRDAFRHGIEVGQEAVTDGSGIGVILVGALHRALRDARRARAWLDAGNPPDASALAEALGMAPFTAPRVLDHARGLRGADLDGFFRALLACDRGVKGPAGPPAALERLVAEWALLAAPGVAFAAGPAAP